MRFADPHACPDCLSAIEGNLRCPHCGLDLSSAPARQLWQTLLQADVLLGQARALDAGGVLVAAAPRHEAAAAPATAGLPSYQQSVGAGAARPSRSLSPGSILLGLGALFILVAGFIFVTVSWGSLGVGGRALVLLTFTAVVGALARWVSRRALGGSAESLWAVFLGLFTLDWFAAYSQGLLGLDAAPLVLVATVWTAVIFAAASLIVVWARPLIGRQMVTPMLAAGVAPWYGAGVLAFRLYDGADWSPFWTALTVTVFAAGFLLTAVRLGHRLTVSLLAALSSVAAGVAAVTAVVEAADHPSRTSLITERHGLPMVVLIVLIVVAGVTLRKVSAVASAAAALGTGLLIVLPIEDAWPARGAFVTVAAAVVMSALALRASDQWSKGGRVATGLATAGLLLAAVPWVANLLSAIGDGARGSGHAAFWQRARIVDEAPGPAWLAAVVFAAPALVLLLASWWPEAIGAAPILRPSAWVLGAVGVVCVVAAGRAPYALLALAFVVVGVALSEVLAKRQLAWHLAGPACVAVAPIIPLISRSATLAIWLLAAVVLAVISVRSRDAWTRDGSAFSGAGWAMGAVAVAAELTVADDRATSLALVGAAVTGLLIASTPLRSWPGRRAVEAACAVTGSVGLAYAAWHDVDPSWQAVAWLLVGAGLVLLSFVTPDRSWFRWLGSGAIGVAYVLRLVASDVTLVEAFTLPFGLVLLAGGMWAIRRPDAPSSLTALGPAVSLILLPSLPQALDEPGSVRGLALFVAALLMVLAGVRQGWRLPFMAGSVVLALLAVANIGPYAWAVPRWVLIAGAGALLLAVGVTWEDRVRDGRKLATYVRAMR